MSKGGLKVDTSSVFGNVEPVRFKRDDFLKAVFAYKKITEQENKYYPIMILKSFINSVYKPYTEEQDDTEYSLAELSQKMQGYFKKSKVDIDVNERVGCHEFLLFLENTRGILKCKS